MIFVFVFDFSDGWHPLQLFFKIFKINSELTFIGFRLKKIIYCRILAIISKTSMKYTSQVSKYEKKWCPIWLCANLPHYIREAKSLLSWYIYVYTVSSSHNDVAYLLEHRWSESKPDLWPCLYLSLLAIKLRSRQRPPQPIKSCGGLFSEILPEMVG